MFWDHKRGRKLLILRSPKHRVYSFESFFSSLFSHAAKEQEDRRL